MPRFSRLGACLVSLLVCAHIYLVTHTAHQLGYIASAAKLWGFSGFETASAQQSAAITK